MYNNIVNILARLRYICFIPVLYIVGIMCILSSVCFKLPLREEAVSQVTTPYTQIFIVYLPKYTYI